jgi:hypothetical protein
MEDNQIIEKAREIIQEGELTKHDLIHRLCCDNDLFGEIDGNKLDSLEILSDDKTEIIETQEFPVYEFNEETGEQTQVGVEEKEVVVGYNEVYPKYVFEQNKYKYIPENDE